MPTGIFDRCKIKGRTKETHSGVAAQAEKLRGRTKENHPGVAAHAKALKGRTKENYPGVARMAEALRGVKRGPHSEETKEKMRGHRIPRETRICIYLDCSNTFECKITSGRKYCSPKCYWRDMKGRASCNKNRKHSKEYREHCKVSQENLWQNPEYREMQSRSHEGYEPSEETKRKCRESKVKFYSSERGKKEKLRRKKLWEDPEYREKHLEAMFKGLRLLPNKPEKFLIKLLQELFPNQWKYIGDGKAESSIVAGKCPDFIHVNQKKIIEHFGDYHHGEGKTGISNEQHEQERIAHFAKYGYQTLIIWQHELEDIDELANKILEFNNARNT